MQMFAIIVSLAVTAVALVITARAVSHMVGVIRTGQPASRTDRPGARAVTMLKESLLHTRMLQWHWVGIMHWFVYAAFLFLSSAVLAGYFQLFDPEFAIPLIGSWFVYEWLAEVLGLLGTVGIIFLIVYRQLHHPRSQGRRSRFFGSTQWQAYFVEAMVLLESAAILFIRGAEYKLLEDATRFHFPLSAMVGELFYPDSPEALKNIIFFVAMVKIVSAMAWLIVISNFLTMGIAWHRFTAWFNIFFKRESSGGTALGAMKPLTSDGVAITLDDIDELDEDATLGVGKVEDFSWKGILDFTTCTECGRCQSQCPAWNTEKPLSPKLLVMGLRDHAYAKAPYVQAGGEGSETATALLERDETVADAAQRSLVGSRSDEEQWFYNPEGGDFVIDADVLWSCTSCGACVQQCPVDIEHVDHIMDMRRYQLLVESNFPAELNQLFKGLENKGNPWNMSPTARMDWAKGLDFDVPVVGEDLESLDSVDWLFWVGCAGAYEDRAKKTTRAVAELLNIAGVSFGVLGNGETCTGDPARRAGNEFVFQGLAMQNVETFKEHKVKKVVSTCAHCFNTLRNEYKDFGIELEVVHHTQLLNRLVREGKLTAIKDGAGAAKRSITYHDPCFLGRHNEVYTPPRELLQILPGAELKEMERNSEKSFCCGAGGARMWMEENIGERINVNRTKEAVATGADQIAVGCPFCRVMLSDGLTAEQAKGDAREEVEVLDVAQMLLASVRGEPATKAGPGTAAPAAAAAPAVAAASTAAGSAATSTVTSDVATKDEPEVGDVTVTDETVTDTADVGPAAKASGGSSLFDVDADSPATEEAPAADKPAEKPAEKSGGSSLFDLDAPAEETPAPQPARSTTPEPAEPAGGGSLFDLAAPSQEAPAPEPTEKPAPQVDESADTQADQPKAESASVAEPAAQPAADLGAGGSLFDLDAPSEPSTPTPTPSERPEAVAEPETVAPAPAASEPAPATTIPEGGSLFDLSAPAEPQAPAASATPTQPDDSVAPETEAAPEPEAAPEKAASETQPATDVDITGLGSLFDLEAPAEETQAATLAAADDDLSAEPAEEPAEESEPPTAKPPSGGDAHPPRTDDQIGEAGSLFDL